MWIGVLGYTVLYFGVRMWEGQPVTFAESLGFGAKKK